MGVTYKYESWGPWVETYRTETLVRYRRSRVGYQSEDQGRTWSGPQTYSQEKTEQLKPKQIPGTTRVIQRGEIIRQRPPPQAPPEPEPTPTTPELQPEPEPKVYYELKLRRGEGFIPGEEPGTGYIIPPRKSPKKTVDEIKTVGIQTPMILGTGTTAFQQVQTKKVTVKDPGQEISKQVFLQKMYEAKTPVDTKYWHPDTKVYEKPTKEGATYSVSFPYPGAEKYGYYKKKLKDPGLTFATAFTSEDPLGIPSAYYVATGQKQTALDIKIQALHGFTQKSFPEYYISSPVTQIGLAEAGAIGLGKVIPYAGSAIAAKYGAGAATAFKTTILGGGAVAVSIPAKEIVTEVQAGRTGEAIGKATVLGLSIGAAYEGYKFATHPTTPTWMTQKTYGKIYKYTPKPIKKTITKVSTKFGEWKFQHAMKTGKGIYRPGELKPARPMETAEWRYPDDEPFIGDYFKSLKSSPGKYPGIGAKALKISSLERRYGPFHDPKKPAASIKLEGKPGMVNILQRYYKPEPYSKGTQIGLHTGQMEIKYGTFRSPKPPKYKMKVQGIPGKVNVYKTYYESKPFSAVTQTVLRTSKSKSFYEPYKPRYIMEPVGIPGKTMMVKEGFRGLPYSEGTKIGLHTGQMEIKYGAFRSPSRVYYDEITYEGSRMYIGKPLRDYKIHYPMEAYDIPSEYPEITRLTFRDYFPTIIKGKELSPVIKIGTHKTSPLKFYHPVLQYGGVMKTTPVYKTATIKTSPITFGVSKQAVSYPTIGKYPTSMDGWAIATGGISLQQLEAMEENIITTRNKYWFGKAPSITKPILGIKKITIQETKFGYDIIQEQISRQTTKQKNISDVIKGSITGTIQESLQQSGLQQQQQQIIRQTTKTPEKYKMKTIIVKPPVKIKIPVKKYKLPRLALEEEDKKRLKRKTIRMEYLGKGYRYRKFDTMKMEDLLLGGK